MSVGMSRLESLRICTGMRELNKPNHAQGWEIMSIEKLVAIAELVAAIAVVVSLLYLAAQVRQSNQLARAQTRERMTNQAGDEVYKGFIDEPEIVQSLYKADALTETEWIRLSGWLLAAMRQREYEFFQMKSGNIEKEVWMAYRGLITIHLGSDRTRKWWDTWGKVPFDRGFCDMVSELLDEQAKPHYFDDLLKLVDDQDPGPGRQVTQAFAHTRQPAPGPPVLLVPAITFAGFSWS